MNIIDKIGNGDCTIEELEILLDEKNPIILYHVMRTIGKYGRCNEGIITKLNEMSLYREAEDKLIGYYKIGDLAIATLQKIGLSLEAISSYQLLDDFERKMIVQLYNELDW